MRKKMPGEKKAVSHTRRELLTCTWRDNNAMHSRRWPLPACRWQRWACERILITGKRMALMALLGVSAKHLRIIIQQDITHEPTHARTCPCKQFWGGCNETQAVELQNELQNAYLCFESRSRNAAEVVQIKGKSVRERLFDVFGIYLSKQGKVYNFFLIPLIKCKRECFPVSKCFSCLTSAYCDHLSSPSFRLGRFEGRFWAWCWVAETDRLGTSTLESNLRDNNTYMVWHSSEEGKREGREAGVETTRNRWETKEHNELVVKRKNLWRKTQGHQSDKTREGSWAVQPKIGRWAGSRRSEWIFTARCWGAIEQGSNPANAQSISLV